MKVCSLDIGGSSVKHAMIEVSGKTATLLDRPSTVRLPTKRFADLRGIVVDVVRRYMKADPSIRTIAISTTGSVDASGFVLRAGHFDDYENVSWSDVLQAEVDSVDRILAVNDGKASTWAEYSHLPEPCSAFAHIVVGTGIGGGLILLGDIFFGDNGFAGYIGHLKTNTDCDVECSCSRIGCVETVAAAPAIVRMYNERARTRSPQLPSFDDITSLARKGDQHALDAFSYAGSRLGVAVSDVMNLLSPRYITLGGGVLAASATIATESKADPFLSAMIETAMRSCLPRIAASTVILPGKLGNSGGLIGAALMASKR